MKRKIANFFIILSLLVLLSSGIFIAHHSTNFKIEDQTSSLLQSKNWHNFTFK